MKREQRTKKLTKYMQLRDTLQKKMNHHRKQFEAYSKHFKTINELIAIHQKALKKKKKE